jgi:hypothetical protein
MDQERLFATLGKQKKAILFDLLQDAYETMNTEQRRHVFGEFAEQEWQSANINGRELLDRIQHFHRDSLNGVYYAPSISTPKISGISRKRRRNGSAFWEIV